MASRSRKPQSLNDSHYRLLQDLTTPRPSKASSPSIDQNPLPAFRLEEEDERSPPIVAESNRVLGDVDTGVPQFSAITDFGTSPGENRAKKVDMEGQCHGKVSSRNYDGFENGKAAGEHEFAGVSEKNEPVKVKIQGRRRLCKLSSQESTEVDDKPSYDKPKLFDITDFDSPLPTQTCEAIGSDIRDILNDLSSRLELLSVERRPPPKEKEAAQDRPILVKDEEISEGENIEAPEYASAESSFSVASDSFDVLSNVRKIVADKARSFKQTLNASFDRDDVDHTCQSVKHVVKPSAKITKEDKEKSGQDIIDVSDESVDKIHADDENYFILSGLKFTYKLPRKIAKMLYPHQVDGLKWLWSLHCKGKGGILGDDMGLGKTMQICGFLAGLFSSRLIKRALIVSPKTLLSHWLKELSAVGLSEKTREYFATCPRTRQYELQYVLQDKGILLTTYDIVRNNSKSLRGDFYFKDDELDEDNMTWDYMILDEGHLIKNPSTQRAKSLLEIPAAHRIVISGTPIQNNLKELWALFHFCCPELLGDKKEFKEKYEDPILRGNEKKASERDKRIGSAVAKALRERIQPYFLRRLKNEVFHEDDAIVSKLSKKNDVIVWLRLTSCQRRLYEAFLNSELVLSSFDGSPLAALTILKKICDHPLLLTKRAAEDVLEGMDSMVNPDDVDMAEKLATHIADIGDREGFQETHDGISCKTSFIISLLDNLIPEGHNVLIFSQTRKMLNLIQESLMSSGYKYLRIDGTTKASDRIKIVNDFQEGIGAPIFLLTSQVGGLGLTLTRADRVIVVDPAWNPSTDNQSVDRAYRIGQKKDVIVYRLMTCGTIEEKIYRKQIFKGGLFKTATEHKEQIRYFSQQDLKELFSLPKEGFDISPTQQQLNEEHDHLHRMDESLKSHIEFLETLGIAGVSHHSLLYSKTAPVQVAEEEAEVIRINSTAFVRNPSSAASQDRDVDGAAYAFNPKDVKLNRKSQTPGSGSSSNKGTESDIKDRISRLSRMLADKATIMRLPDKGERIEKQLAELNLELQKISMAQRAELEVIDLDDISGDFQKLNM